MKMKKTLTMTHHSDLLKGSLCYGSGPVDRVPDRGRGWREYIKPKLKELGVGFLNPLKKPFYGNYVEDDTFVIRRDSLLELKMYDDLAELMKVKVCRPDLSMVDKSDFLIVYIDTDVHMAGTYHELSSAITQRKPTLIMCKQGKQGIPFWWWGVIPHEFFFSSWDELLLYLKQINDGKIEATKRWRFFDMSKVY